MVRVASAQSAPGLVIGSRRGLVTLISVAAAVENVALLAMTGRTRYVLKQDAR